MKFISIAIALLASAAIVASHPIYGDDEEDYDHEHRDDETSTSTTPWYYPSDTPTSTSDAYDSNYETNTPSYNEYSSQPTYCDGFNITNPSEGANYTTNDRVEVTFDSAGSSITKVETIDLVTDRSHHLVDEWATGPWNSSDQRTGSHGLHIHSDESGDYQFRVFAATADDRHCKYYSPKFTITYVADNHDEDTTSTSNYDDATSTYSDPSESTY